MDIALFHLLFLFVSLKAHRSPNVANRLQVDAGGREPKAKIGKLWIKSCQNTSCQETAINIQRKCRRKNSQAERAHIECISLLYFSYRSSCEILISASYLLYLTRRGLGKQVLWAKDEHCTAVDLRVAVCVTQRHAVCMRPCFKHTSVQLIHF